VGKVKVLNTGLDQNLNGTNFNNTASQTIFQFGGFTITSNFEGRKPVDYNNVLSTFVRPVTLETLGVNETQSKILYEYSINAVLNLNKSDLNTFIRFGSAYEFLRNAIQNIILAYPASLFANSNVNPGGNLTIFSAVTNALSGITTFRIPSEFITNTFGLVYNMGNISKPNDVELRNLNLSYDKYVIWSKYVPESYFPIIGFTGNTSGIPYVVIKTIGDPFPFNSGNTIGYFDFHIRPNSFVFEEFRSILDDYEQYIISERDGTNGFQFTINNPTLLDDGNIVYGPTTMLWTTMDGYNIDISNSLYQRFLEILLTIGAKYDSIKTDLIARFLTPSSIKTYDLTEDGKMTKLLRVYGREFDQMREFIDSLVYINTTTYNKINNIPDQLISNLARTFGWDYFNLVNEAELVDSILTVDDTERNTKTDLLPAEVNIELWRRILINTNYFWKSKGTREAIKAIFLLIGIPEPFINITEYVYTVDGKIDPREVTLTQADFPSNSLPYDNSGYPVAPIETNSFYFQVSGDTDGGQAYMNAFRMAGFDLNETVDNRKSWIQTGATTRIDSTTPQYYQEDSKLVLNTKMVDVALDTARGIEYDVYSYIKDIDFPANSSGYVLPFTYVNISLGYTGTENTFTLPAEFNKAEGDIEVRFNGILLNAPKEYDGSSVYTETTEADYTITGNTFTLANGIFARDNNGGRDVIQATYIYSGSTINPLTGVTIQYIVTRVKPNIVGTIIPLPDVPNGDVQVTINGIALTKGTPQFIGDYIVDPNNPSQIIIQNPAIIAEMTYLKQTNNAFVEVAYVTINGSTSIFARSEIVRVDSFNSSKIYYNVSANKYVYRLNYKITDTRKVKILIDGILLEPQTDYSVNVNNPYEIYLPSGLKYGSIISAYYLVGGEDIFRPAVSDSFGLGDITKLSFLEFSELIQRRLINAKNRKIITDFKGGWYPTLLAVYIKYLKRGELPESNPLHSNGYTFVNLYPFLSKYNAFFQRFVDELLSATIILKKGGLLIRNTIFTKQKFTYKRGVYMGYINTISPTNAATFRYDNQLNYFGDDGSKFLKKPLVQKANWNSDFICVGNLCSNFVVNNVVISYPTDTNTTTAYPYTALMTITEVTTAQQTVDNGSQTGWYGVSNYTIAMSPTVLPGYSVNVKFNFISKLYINLGTDNESDSIITIKRNGIQIYYIANQQVSVNTSTDVLDTSTISIGSGDIIQIILENLTLKDGGVSIVTSETIMTPTIISVLPNGSIPSIAPPSISHTIPAA
jgi:hypothetical protein